MEYYWYILFVFLYILIAYIVGEFNWRMYKRQDKGGDFVGILLWPGATLRNDEAEKGFWLNDFKNNKDFYLLTFILCGGFLVKITMNLIIYALAIVFFASVLCIIIAVQIIYTGGVLVIKLCLSPLRLFGIKPLISVKPFKFVSKLLSY